MNECPDIGDRLNSWETMGLLSARLIHSLSNHLVVITGNLCVSQIDLRTLHRSLSSSANEKVRLAIKSRSGLKIDWESARTDLKKTRLAVAYEIFSQLHLRPHPASGETIFELPIVSLLGTP